MVAEVKTLNFYEGVVVTPPDTTQPLVIGDGSLPHHAVAIEQLNPAIVAQGLSVMGSVAVPVTITNTGLAFTGNALDNLWYIKATANLDLSATLIQIAAGAYVGQKLRIFIKGAFKITFANTNGMKLKGDYFVGEVDSNINLNYNGSVWEEEIRG